MQGQVGKNMNSEVDMQLPATPETSIDTTEDGAIWITQSVQGEDYIVYFAPEIAMVVAQEVIRQATAAIHARRESNAAG
jgi:hypothetical protein